MEILLVIVDKKNPNSVHLDNQCPKAGDVLAVNPDGFAWGKEELANPDWRIVGVPDLTTAQAAALVAHEPGDPATNRMVRSRGNRLNLDLLTPNESSALRGPRSVKLSLTSARVAELLTVKQPVSDPHVVGPSGPVVLG